jgi:hypothetical protein
MAFNGASDRTVLRIPTTIGVWVEVCVYNNGVVLSPAHIVAVAGLGM